MKTNEELAIAKAIIDQNMESLLRYERRIKLYEGEVSALVDELRPFPPRAKYSNRVVCECSGRLAVIVDSWRGMDLTVGLLRRVDPDSARVLFARFGIPEDEQGLWDEVRIEVVP